MPQLGGWHSATDMHLRAVFTELTRDIFELIHGVFTHQGRSAGKLGISRKNLWERMRRLEIDALS